MDNFACDLLVHITASSRLEDDNRYATIAQSVLDFQPLTTTRLIGRASQSRSSNDTDVLDSIDTQDTWPNPDDASSTWIQAHDDALKDDLRDREGGAEQQTFLTASGPSLFEEAGGRSFSAVNRSSGQPDLPRPRTAPENSSLSLESDIPFNGTSRRRAYSEVSSFSDSFLTVPNSHATSSHPDLHVPSDEMSLNADQFRVRERMLSPRGEPQLKKRRLDNDIIADDSRISLELAHHMEPPFGFIPTTPDQPSAGKKNPSQPKTESKSASSTLSPSQPLKLGGVGSLTLSPHIPSVDLTTPPREQQMYQHEKILEPNLAQQKPPVDNRLHGDNARHTDIPPFMSRTQELADEINGPDPAGGQQRFTTHITKTYELLSERISMAKVFRPTHVARDVLALERGHWLFSIRIGADDDVAESRKALSQEERRAKLRRDLEGTTCLERVRKFDGKRAVHEEESSATTPNSPLWTEADFTTFWGNMSQFIRDGKAGWGSRLVKEANQDNTWDVRFFCWGEVLGHAWLALWILSDKLVGRMPMTWVSADGLAVVRMSGKKHRNAELGSWIRKAEGQSGYWGVGEK
ncbi:uncharacterized protein A1O9_12159 [Exophiala aquamarina CBS 119918]|uniref:Uncharacterized protein n=1 Tax=Exophiala aquamarina CBS 119918 TaxID=1182545 RepID=A0A072NWM9_9EURO|nr:uncharacterized protein A1O9_12159 [Exophiala aquamarina CBS 119918]KEF51822.1 hypothetical protein A1O9_12159 [Exophiala aquamarina CBS 119918]